jgi:hypothetical protein
VVAQHQVVLNLKAVGYRLEALIEGGNGGVKSFPIPFQAGREKFAAPVDVIVRVQDTAVVADQKLHDRPHHSLMGERDRTAAQ